MKKFKVLLVLAIALIVSACGGANNQNQPAEGTFTLAVPGNPTSTSPFMANDRVGLTVVSMIYSPLATIDSNSAFQYVLAQSSEVAADNLSMTVHLKNNVQFSDGTPLTADDVVFTYEVLRDHPVANSNRMFVNEQPVNVVAVDEHTVRFEFPEVSAAALNNILTNVWIAPRHVFENEPDFTAADTVAHPVGTGPYKMVDYNRDQYLSFVANENYFAGTPHIENIILRVIPSADTQRIALQNGDVDGAIILPVDVASVQNDNINIYPIEEGRVGYIAMNTATPQLQDVRVRQAIRYALDTHEMNLAAYLNEDFFKTPTSFLPPSNPFATADGVNQFATNLDRARELLAEAGVSNLTINIGFNGSDPAQTAQATLAQQQLAQVGITLNLDPQDGATFWSQVQDVDAHNFNLFTGGYIMGVEPNNYRTLFGSGMPNNNFGTNNPEIDRLFAEGAVETNPEQRQAIYTQLQQLISEEAFFVPIVDNLRILAMNSRIGGVEEAGLVPIYTFGDMSKLYIR